MDEKLKRMADLLLAGDYQKGSELVFGLDHTQPFTVQWAKGSKPEIEYFPTIDYFIESFGLSSRYNLCILYAIIKI